MGEQKKSRPVHALRPNKGPGFQPMVTYCYRDPYRFGMQIHFSELSDPVTCPACLKAMKKEAT